MSPLSGHLADTLYANRRSMHGGAEINDVWTFERNLAQPDPAWRLTAARSG